MSLELLELLHRIYHTKTVLLSNIESGWERIELKSSSSSDGKPGGAWGTRLDSNLSLLNAGLVTEPLEQKIDFHRQFGS